MKISDLTEARRNKNHPSQKDTRVSKVGFINKFIGKDGYYLSFQDLPKLGYNPSMKHGGTPAGIYAYPMLHFGEEVYSDDEDTLSETFPYGSGRNNLFAFTFSGKTLFMDSYSKSNLKEDLQKNDRHETYHR